MSAHVCGVCLCQSRFFTLKNKLHLQAGRCIIEELESDHWSASSVSSRFVTRSATPRLPTFPWTPSGGRVERWQYWSQVTPLLLHNHWVCLRFMKQRSQLIWWHYCGWVLLCVIHIGEYFGCISNQINSWVLFARDQRSLIRYKPFLQCVKWLRKNSNPFAIPMSKVSQYRIWVSWKNLN